MPERYLRIAAQGAVGQPRGRGTCGAPGTGYLWCSGLREAESAGREPPRPPRSKEASGQRGLLSSRDYGKSVCFNNTFLGDLIVIGVFHIIFLVSRV